MAQLAVEAAAAVPEGLRRGARCGKNGRARRHTGLADGGPASGFCSALLLELVGARCAAPAALLRRESPFPRTRARRARMQTSEQREDPKGWHGRWGRAGAAVAGRWQRCNNTVARGRVLVHGVLVARNRFAVSPNRFAAFARRWTAGRPWGRGR